MNWSGLEFSREQFDKITSIDADAWKDEVKLHDELFDKLAYHLPQELVDTRKALESRMSA